MYKVGERVGYKSDADAWSGTVIYVAGGNILHVRRDDGTRGSGIDWSWTVTQENVFPIGGASPVQQPVFTSDAATRNEYPMAEGLLYYFPNALAAVSQVSVAGNKQHNLGPLHWDRSKSTNHADKILRHQVDAGTMDSDGTRHSAKVAWRALAQLEDELIAAGATPGKNARNSPNEG